MFPKRGQNQEQCLLKRYAPLDPHNYTHNKWHGFANNRTGAWG